MRLWRFGLMQSKLMKGYSININLFFLFIVGGLMMIFFLFKPMDIKEQNFDDIPLFEMSAFTLLEFNPSGLATLMVGESATRYNDRYKVKKINYTDNTQEFRANMKANEGLYRDEIVDLNGDVAYVREDGLIFKSESASYDKKTATASTLDAYVSEQGANKVIGTALKYNNLLKRVESKNIVVNYQLKER